jgi:hypothetical protein
VLTIIRQTDLNATTGSFVVGTKIEMRIAHNQRGKDGTFG